MKRAYERLLDYVMWGTQSDRNTKNVPSTPGQLLFSHHLVEEVKALGIQDVTLDALGYIYGLLPANGGKDHLDVTHVPTIGFLAHVDTAEAHPSVKKKPKIIHNYDGSVITLESGAKLDPDFDDRLLKLIGDDLIVTDGYTLLGGDDKAGIAEIMTALEFFMEHPEIPHGNIAFSFTPDEEIGESQTNFNVEAFRADFAYTVDGGQFGELDQENFNAASANITIKGITVHAGSAKNKMRNPAVVAMEFDQMLPAWERPEHTEGYEGYYHLEKMDANGEVAHMHYNIREFDTEQFQRRKETVCRIAEMLTDRYGAGTVTVEIKNGYRNMAEKLRPHLHLIEYAKEAIAEMGYEPIVNPSRGGTDGCELSYKGVPCPNMGTGNIAAHSVREVASVQKMDLCVELIIKLIKRYAFFEG